MKKYDDVDFHSSDSGDQGSDVDGAFTHIGLMLVWLIRHDLASQQFFSPEIVEEVKEGSLRPNDLRDVVDGQLMSVMLTSDGARFLDAYYPDGYGDDYSAEFVDLPEYGVPDDQAHQDSIGRRISAAWDRWLKAGRPGPTVEAPIWPGPDPDSMLAELAAAHRGTRSVPTGVPLSGSMKPPSVDVPEDHLDPRLESVMLGALGTDTKTQSRDARVWRSSLLNRVLRALSVAPSDALVVTGIGRERSDPVAEIHYLPGIDSSRLRAEYGVYFTERSRQWKDGSIGPAPARWAVWQQGSLPEHTMVWYALDGYVVHVVSPQRSKTEAVALRIAEGLSKGG